MNQLATLDIFAGGPGSGCHGDNCGRPRLYHGTSSDRLEAIQREGVRVKRNIPIFTDRKDEAIAYAKMVAEERGSKPVLITLKPESSKHFDSGDTDVGHSSYRGTTLRHVKPEHFESVEHIESDYNKMWDKTSVGRPGASKPNYTEKELEDFKKKHDIKGGGPGSGCKGDNCGRKGGHKANWQALVDSIRLEHPHAALALENALKEYKKGSRVRANSWLHIAEKEYPGISKLLPAKIQKSVGLVKHLVYRAPEHSDVYAGGPGSGCNPDAGTCGRHTGVGGYAKSHGFDKPTKQVVNPEQSIKKLYDSYSRAYYKTGRKGSFSDFVKSVDPANAAKVIAHDTAKRDNLTSVKKMSHDDVTREFEKSTEPVVSRAKDYSHSGEYDVTIGSKTYQMYRDRESGWWFQANTGKHFSQATLGFNKAEAINKLVENHKAANSPTTDRYDPRQKSLLGPQHEKEVQKTGEVVKLGKLSDAMHKFIDNRTEHPTRDPISMSGLQRRFSDYSKAQIESGLAELKKAGRITQDGIRFKSTGKAKASSSQGSSPKLFSYAMEPVPAVHPPSLKNPKEPDVMVNKKLNQIALNKDIILGPLPQLIPVVPSIHSGRVIPRRPKVRIRHFGPPRAGFIAYSRRGCY
jgi:hypothetical protein